MKTIVNLDQYGDSRFKSWSKALTGVDREQSTGYAFQGNFLNAGQKHELEVGTYILQYGEEGSAKYHKPCVQLLKVTAEGLETLKEWRELDKSWALEVRDEIAEIIAVKEQAADSHPAFAKKKVYIIEFRENNHVIYAESLEAAKAYLERQGYVETDEYDEELNLAGCYELKQDGEGFASFFEASKARIISRPMIS